MARLIVDPKGADNYEFPKLSLALDSGQNHQLDIDSGGLARLATPSPIALEFLGLASAVYALDKLVPRRDSNDRWTRNISLSMPSKELARTDDAGDLLSQLLGFLGGDHWEVSLTSSRSLAWPRRQTRLNQLTGAQPPADVVCLFSGGLDSLIGVIDVLESTDLRVMLVGHHDRHMKGPLSDQKALLRTLTQSYPGRVQQMLVRVGHFDRGPDITLRYRSLLFIALALYASSSSDIKAPVLVPENGTIALNVPLTPSRRGTCSTRTTHPRFLRDLNRFTETTGLGPSLDNPLEGKTKGEAVAECKNAELLHELAPLSVSCAKRGHKSTWRRRSAKGCGRCMPCIYRRAALHKVGWDTESYGVDICRGEVDVEDSGQAPNDLRACLSFLRAAPSPRQIEMLLLTNGNLEIGRLQGYAQIVDRAMNEIRMLISDKGTATIRKLAGV